jgi:uncharacterized protein YrrD
MTDLGASSSYMTLQQGAPVFSRQGKQVGTVHVVVADHGADAFDAIVVAKEQGLRVALAEEVQEIREGGVVLALDTKQCSLLRTPQAEPAVPDEVAAADAGRVRTRLRRAWELVSGES